MAPSFSSSPEPEPSTSAVPHPSSSFSSTHPTLPSSSSSAAVAQLPPSIKLDLDAELDELLDGPQPPAVSTASAADTKPRAGGAGAKSSGLGKGWRAGKGTGKGKSKKKKVSPLLSLFHLSSPLLPPPPVPHQASRCFYFPWYSRLTPLLLTSLCSLRAGRSRRSAQQVQGQVKSPPSLPPLIFL